jgi:hypothetical protein
MKSFRRLIWACCLMFLVQIALDVVAVINILSAPSGSNYFERNYTILILYMSLLVLAVALVVYYTAQTLAQNSVFQRLVHTAKEVGAVKLVKEFTRKESESLYSLSESDSNFSVLENSTPSSSASSPPIDIVIPSADSSDDGPTKYSTPSADYTLMSNMTSDVTHTSDSPRAASGLSRSRSSLNSSDFTAEPAMLKQVRHIPLASRVKDVPLPPNSVHRYSSGGQRVGSPSMNSFNGSFSSHSLSLSSLSGRFSEETASSSSPSSSSTSSASMTTGLLKDADIPDLAEPLQDES